MIEVRLNRLENMRRNKETLPTQSLTIPDTSSYIEEKQESWYLEDFDQDQPIDELVSFYFDEIELDYECTPDPQLCDSVSIIESMLTTVFLPNFD